MLPPPVTGLVARYFGAPGGTTARNYWVQAIYADGDRSVFAGPVLVSNTPAGLGGGFPAQSGAPNAVGNFVALSWNPAPGAVAYDVVCTGASTAYPSGSNAAIGLVVGISQNNYIDTTVGAYAAYTPVQRNFVNVAVMRYDFSVDGGASVTPSVSDVIPINALLIGATVNTTAAVTAAGAATVAIGTTAGSAGNSILTATGKATFVVATPFNGTVTLAAPVKMTATGQINITVATGPLTAGAFEVYVYYVLGTA